MHPSPLFDDRTTDGPVRARRFEPWVHGARVVVGPPERLWLEAGDRRFGLDRRTGVRLSDEERPSGEARYTLGPDALVDRALGGRSVALPDGFRGWRCEVHVDGDSAWVVYEPARGAIRARVARFHDGAFEVPFDLRAELGRFAARGNMFVTVGERELCAYRGGALVLQRPTAGRLRDATTNGTHVALAENAGTQTHVTLFVPSGPTFEERVLVVRAEGAATVTLSALDLIVSRDDDVLLFDLAALERAPAGPLDFTIDDVVTPAPGGRTAVVSATLGDAAFAVPDGAPRVRLPRHAGPAVRKGQTVILDAVDAGVAKSFRLPGEAPRALSEDRRNLAPGTHGEIPEVASNPVRTAPVAPPHAWCTRIAYGASLVDEDVDEDVTDAEALAALDGQVEESGDQRDRITIPELAGQLLAILPVLRAALGPPAALRLDFEMYTAEQPPAGLVAAMREQTHRWVEGAWYNAYELTPPPGYQGCCVTLHGDRILSVTTSPPTGR